MVFIAGAFVARNIDLLLAGNHELALNNNIHDSIVSGIALLISLPILIATYRKLKAMSMILSEMWIHQHIFGNRTYTARRVIFETLPVIVIIWIISLILSINQNNLPSPPYLAGLLFAVMIIALIFWSKMVKIQSWLQIQLFTVMEDKPE